jgi:tRNA pseudouridine13 synthase
MGGRAEPHWQGLASPAVQVLAVCRHRRRLRRGDLEGNHFRVRVRRLTGDTEELVERLERIRRQGFPNYFGEQRFGHGYANLAQAELLFGGRLREVDRHRRGLYLSAVRSQLFNEVLAARVQGGTWNKALPGELLMLEPNRGWFPVNAVDAGVEEKVDTLGVHPTGPLWGTGFSALTGVAADTEQAVLAAFGSWCKGLERCGLHKDRRALRALAKGLSWGFPGPALLELELELPAGSYATAALRELLQAGYPEDGR